MNKLLSIITFISIAILAISGLQAVWFTDKPLTGIPLTIHCVVAPVAAIAFVFWSIIHVGRHSQRIGPSSKERLNRFSFWGMLTLAIPMILTIVLCMFPIFNPAQQKSLIHWHYYTSLGLTILAVIFILTRTKSPA